MAKKLYEENSVKAIADAIRGKNGSTDTYKIAEMASAINSLSQTNTADGTIEDYQVTAGQIGYAKGQKVTGTYDPVVWIMKTEITLPETTFSPKIHFKTKGISSNIYSSISIGSSAILAARDDNTVTALYANSQWTQDSQKWIFLEEPTGDLLTWLEANGTKRVPGFFINQTGTASVTSNGTTTFTPAEPYDGFSQISVTTNVQPKLETKTTTITANGSQSITPGTGYDGLSQVDITTNITPNLQTKDITITSNGTTTISADSAYDGLSTVNVTTDIAGSGSSDIISQTLSILVYFQVDIQDNFGLWYFSPIEGMKFISGNQLGNEQTIQIVQNSPLICTPYGVSETSIFNNTTLDNFIFTDGSGQYLTNDYTDFPIDYSYIPIYTSFKVDTSVTAVTFDVVNWV